MTASSIADRMTSPSPLLLHFGHLVVHSVSMLLLFVLVISLVVSSFNYCFFYLDPYLRFMICIIITNNTNNNLTCDPPP